MSKVPENKTIQIIHRDHIRTLRVHQTGPCGHASEISTAEFALIKARSQNLIKQENEALNGKLVTRSETLKAAQQMKSKMYEIDLARTDREALTELELKALDHERRLRDRADDARIEENKEIRQLNGLVTSAKYHEARKAQILENEKFREHLKEQEKHLDAAVEAEQSKHWKKVEQEDEGHRQKMINGRQQIFNQIQERQQKKQLEKELLEREKQKVRETQERMRQEDLHALMRKREEQQLLNKEIMRINAEAIRAKEEKKKEEILLDLKNNEYIQRKLQQEAEHEEEQRKIQKEKEMEIARLRAQQERVRDVQAERDANHARRAQLVFDREWRRKQKEMATKKAEQDAQLRAARLDQIRCNEHFMSIDASRKKSEFERVQKAQQEAVIKFKEEGEKKRQNAILHSEAINQRIKENQLLAAAKHQQAVQEANRLRELDQQMRKRLDQVREKKLKELRDDGFSEMCCSDVARRAANDTHGGRRRFPAHALATKCSAQMQGTVVPHPSTTRGEKTLSSSDCFERLFQSAGARRRHGGLRKAPLIYCRTAGSPEIIQPAAGWKDWKDWECWECWA
ncbi:cilia- and flagella-associated protein 45-like [Aulostomus maculatus]